MRCAPSAIPPREQGLSMNPWKRRRFLSALSTMPAAAAVSTALSDPLSADKSNPPTLRAGAAKADITLPPGTNMGGVILRGGPAKEVHDPLHARALVLDDGTTRLALVVCDLRMI